MSLGATLRWIVWGCCALAVLLAPRLAAAAAPMCDENGASTIAPPPIMPARDVRLESGGPVGCEKEQHARVAATGPSARQPIPTSTNDVPVEAWIRPSVFDLTKLRASISGRIPTFDSGPTSSHARGVFRPPRLA